MLGCGINESREELHNLINSVIEVLKPWFDKELWYNMKQQEDNTRQNLNWGKNAPMLDEIEILEESRAK